MKQPRSRALPQERRLKTAAEVRQEFQRQGMSIAGWAAKHGLNRNVVYEILSGSTRRRCLRGQSHRAAVLLGLKDGVIVEGAKA